MYTLQQQAFTLSFLSNATNRQTGTAAQIQAAASSFVNNLLTNPAITAQIGSWQIVWGPVVFQETGSDDADNAMVVYQGTSGGSPVYVVGIAATNGLSRFDAQVEDLDVASTVAFGGNGAWISQGTSIGIQKLEGMTDPAGGSLQSFLESKAASTSATLATLIFAGHSLGGALAPTLALDLALHRGFDLTRWANVFVYPSAGPTPGNQAFSELFAQTFPRQQPRDASQPWNVWNMDVVNTLDTVPRAWSQLPTWPALYPPLGPTAQAAVQQLVTSLTAKDDLDTNVYAILPTSSFPGQYNPSPPTAPRTRVTSTVGIEYYNQAYYQHISAYLNTIIREIAPLL